jgi:hypothetical protein
LKTGCDNEPDPCTRCLKANVECLRKPRTEAERARNREKRQLQEFELGMVEDSSEEDDFSTWSEGQQDLENPLEHIDFRGNRSGPRFISPPPIQRKPAQQLVQEDYTSRGSRMPQNREDTDPDTTSHGDHPATSPEAHPRLLSRSLTGVRSRTNTSTPQDARWRHETSNDPNASWQAINYQRKSMVNTTPKSAKLSFQKSLGSGQRPLLDFWGARESRPPFENPQKRGNSALEHITQENHSKKPRVDVGHAETSLPLDMRMNTLFSVSLNGDKPGRAKQRRLGECKNMTALFAEVTKGWEDEGVDEENCYIEVTYRWKQVADNGQVAYLERDQGPGLERVYHEIRENPCWQYDADPWCVIDLKICQEY